jgi:hypothetical protein
MHLVRRLPAAAVLAALLLGSFASGCAHSGRGNLYVEPSINRAGVKVQKVAVVPNRLPATLMEPEKWRRYNWQLVAQELRRRNFEVIDYETCVRTFEKSGLPVEDTHSSRDKYADLAQSLGADAVIVPYYATFAYARNWVLVNKLTFASVATFQFYLAERNDFMARVDASGESSYYTGFLTLAGLGLTLLGAVTGTPELSTVALLPLIGEIVYVLVVGLKPPDSYWEDAFQQAIDQGMRPFFAAFPTASGG